MTLNTAPEEEESTAEVALDPRNLSDTILDSWDSHSDEILSNDQFKDELEKEKQEKAELQELLGTNRYAPYIFHCDNKYFLSQVQIFFIISTSNIFSLDTSPESTDSFPLKSFISEKSGAGGSSAQPVADSEAGAGDEEAINPEKLAYILIGVRP